MPSALEKAFIANLESESIWRAAVKFEAENGELKGESELLIRARTVADTETSSYEDEVPASGSDDGRQHSIGSPKMPAN